MSALGIAAPYETRTSTSPDGLNPYDRQVAENVAKLSDGGPDDRAQAAEALGYLRVYSGQDALIEALDDSSASVRREAALALGWCGDRKAVPKLIDVLEDDDWTVRQAAWVALTNLTAMQLPLDGMAEAGVREGQAAAWRRWWSQVPADTPPEDVFKLIEEDDPVARLRAVRALGALGGRGAADAIRGALKAYPTRDKQYRNDKSRQNERRRTSHTSPPDLEATVARTALRELGRLRDPASLPVLVEYLDDIRLGGYAADALGEYGGNDAARALLNAFPGPTPERKTKDANYQYGTVFWMAFALARNPHTWTDQTNLALLRDKAHLFLEELLLNDCGRVPVHEVMSNEEIVLWLMDRAGLLPVIREATLQHHTSGKLPDHLLIETLRGRSKNNSWRPGVHWLPIFCRDRDCVPALIEALEKNKLAPGESSRGAALCLNAARTLMHIGDERAAEPIARLLAESKPEADYGYRAGLYWADLEEYDDPLPRWRVGLVRALGRLGGVEHVPLFAGLLEDDRNVMDVHIAAAEALAEMDIPEATDALQATAAKHPLHTVRLIAREALWCRGALGSRYDSDDASSRMGTPALRGSDGEEFPSYTRSDKSYPTEAQALVFVKGEYNDSFGGSGWRQGQAYFKTDGGPAYRVGRNLYLLRPIAPGGDARPLTEFADGYVAHPEVSWDGKRVLFCRREQDDPWWHVWEIRVDGSGLRQITSGPYHHVMPAYLPDGRIVCSSSRIAARDEYHGNPCTGLTVLNADGSDVRCIGFNAGRDNDPCILPDGRIGFARFEVFSGAASKQVMTLQAMLADGRKNVTLYGPEFNSYGKGGNLQCQDPHPLMSRRDLLVCSEKGGLTIAGPGRLHRRELVKVRKNGVQMAITPYPLNEKQVLCAGALDDQFVVRNDAAGKDFKAPDLALYLADIETGAMTLLYNDPSAADFEPRPIVARQPPPTLVEKQPDDTYTGRLYCQSAKLSQEVDVPRRGKLVRVIEGAPYTMRVVEGKNHIGTITRVLGTTPLAADGSFYLEIPADRLVNLQVLDSDRRVVGNQFVWMYVRPGETKGCVGCHERSDSTTLHGSGLLASFRTTVNRRPVKCLPTSDEFRYRSFGGGGGVHMTDPEGEERMRLERTINLLGRY